MKQWLILSHLERKRKQNFKESETEQIGKKKENKILLEAMQKPEVEECEVQLILWILAILLLTSFRFEIFQI